MTMTAASKPVCDPTLSGIYVTNTGPDSVEACGEYGESRMEGRYRRWDSEGELWHDYSFTVHRVGTLVTIEHNDGTGEDVSQTTCQASDDFGINGLQGHVPSALLWHNFPCHLFVGDGYIYTGTANIAATADTRDMTVLLIEDERIMDHHRCELTYTCTPNAGACQ